ncbi:MAG: LysM peptidoglycan-binding domain-containing protein [Firmicutes bacterium]|nr:LysM peptidoglycan-binding domain-containing protein [Bacillota bacterium]
MNGKALDIINTISAFCLLIVLAVSAMTIAGKIISKEEIMILQDQVAYTQVVVQPGDTLWSIAVEQMPHEDPRDVVGTIRQLNELRSADIFPGQVLTIEIKLVEPVRLASGPIS